MNEYEKQGFYSLSSDQLKSLGKLRQVFILADTEARLMKHRWLGTPHLVLGLILEGSIKEVMRKTGFDPDINKARAIVRTQFDTDHPDKLRPFTERARFLIKHAINQGAARDTISPIDLYGVLLRYDQGLAETVLDGLKIKHSISEEQ